MRSDPGSPRFAEDETVFGARREPLVPARSDDGPCDAEIRLAAYFDVAALPASLLSAGLPRAPVAQLDRVSGFEPDPTPI